jgi:acylphosphatase
VRAASPPEEAAFFARAEGRVQGVGFRYSCLNEARRRGLQGWVRNTPEGAVEVWAEGPRKPLEGFLQWLRRGPPGARVDRFHQEAQPPTGAYHDFQVEF